MRLLSTILAVFLAVSMAILPISMPQAADLNGGHHNLSVEVTHSQSEADAHLHAVSAECEPATISQAPDCASHNQTSHDPAGGSCCNMSCHAFQVSSWPNLFERVSTGRAVNSTADQQVVGVIASRIDRPPRTI